MLTSSYPRFRGDIAGTFVKSLATHLVGLGHEVHVLAPDDGSTDRSAGEADPGGVVEHRFAYSPIQRLRTLGYAKALEGDRHLRPSAYPMIVPYAFAAYLGLRALVARHNCDVIHAHWLLPNGPMAALVARLTHCPLVLSLHGSDVYVATRNRLFRRISGWTLQQASRVTACSGDLRERAVKLGASSETAGVIPYGVSLEAFGGENAGQADLRRALGIGDADPLILALGRLVFKKGFEYLIDAMPRVLEEYPSAKLVLAGDGYLAKQLRDQANSVGIADALRLPGRVPSDDVPKYMTAADVFVMPSVNDDAGNVDGLPNVVLEAMAAGKAIVASRVGGIPEVISDGQTGLLVPERSSADLARAIRRFLADAVERRDCGEKARFKAEEELSWTKVAQRFVEVYQEAARERRH